MELCLIEFTFRRSWRYLVCKNSLFRYSFERWNWDAKTPSPEYTSDHLYHNNGVSDHWYSFELFIKKSLWPDNMNDLVEWPCYWCQTSSLHAGNLVILRVLEIKRCLAGTLDFQVATIFMPVWIRNIYTIHTNIIHYSGQIQCEQIDSLIESPHPRFMLITSWAALRTLCARILSDLFVPSLLWSPSTSFPWWCPISNTPARPCHACLRFALWPHDQPISVLTIVLSLAGLRDKDFTEEDMVRLRRLGADVVRTNRGGLATFHGPGQLVAYPIINLKQHELGLHRWVTEVRVRWGEVELTDR